MRPFVNVTVHGKSKITIMVWGAIWKDGKSDIVIMTRDQMRPRKGYTSWSYQMALREGLLPFYDGMRRFQQDNAKIHVSQSSIEFLMEHGIEFIDWPAHSPDLNPIEHIWKLLKAKVKQIFPHIELIKRNEINIAELSRCIKLAWAAITTEEINNLIDSLPRRIDACLRAQGWYTKY
jgi:hypothetical protein